MSPPRGNPESLITFGHTLAEAGKRHAVWDVQRLPGATNFDATQGTFEEYLREAVRTRQRVPLPQDVRPGDDLWAPARVAFYRGDEIVQDEIGNLGELLRNLRPEKDTMSARSASPVTIRGVSVPVEYEEEVVVEIRLDTDIWCPRVIGLGEPDDGEEHPDSYDNRALAEIHTPRLNAFIGEVRAATLATGGRWKTWEPDGFGMNYADQWDEFGIRL